MKKLKKETKNLLLDYVLVFGGVVALGMIGAIALPKIPEEIIGGTGIALLVMMGVAAYFLPSIIGWKKKNATAIMMLNLFLGWTMIGWIVSLVWACTKD